jgi:hypothetical protein
MELQFMVNSRYQANNRSGLRRIGIIEYALAASLILGFGFVSLRIMNMPVTISHPVAAGTDVAKADVPPISAEAPVEKTP